MYPRRSHTICFLVVLALGETHAAQAWQTPPAIGPEAAAKTLAPFVDETTIAVAHVDVAHADVEKIAALAAPFIPAGHPLLKMSVGARQEADSFLAAGGRDFYVILSMADLRLAGPFVVLPLGKQSNEQALRAMAGEAFAERVGDALFIGDQGIRRRLAATTPLPRPELTRALKSVSDSPAQVVFIPSASARRVSEELMPTLPPLAGGGSITTLTRGAIWAALGVELSPRPAVRLVVQSQSREAAKTLRGYAATLLHDRLPEGAKLGKLLLPDIKDDRLLLSLDGEQIAEIGGVLRPLADTSAAALRRRAAVDQLKQIGLAMHNYHDVHKHFPPAASSAAAGQPLLSWRVAILPFLEQEALYKEFHLDEPWDSEHNRKLIDRMPAVYRSLASSAAHDRTSFVVATGAGTVFDGGKGTAIQDITDGTSNTLLVLEADDEHAVVWTRPDDFKFDAEHPSAGFTSPYPNGRLLLFCDGSVHFWIGRMEDETLRRLLLRGDGKPLEGPR